MIGEKKPFTAALGELATLNELAEFWDAIDELLESAQSASELGAFALREGNRRLVANQRDRVGKAWMTFLFELEMLMYADDTIDALEHYANAG